MFGVIHGSTNLTTAVAVDSPLAVVDDSPQPGAGFDAIFLHLSLAEVAKHPIPHPPESGEAEAMPAKTELDAEPSDEIELPTEDHPFEAAAQFLDKDRQAVPKSPVSVDLAGQLHVPTRNAPDMVRYQGIGRDEDTRPMTPDTASALILKGESRSLNTDSAEETAPMLDRMVQSKLDPILKARADQVASLPGAARSHDVQHNQPHRDRQHLLPKMPSYAAALPLDRPVPNLELIPVQTGGWTSDLNGPASATLNTQVPVTDPEAWRPNVDALLSRRPQKASEPSLPLPEAEKGNPNGVFTPRQPLPERTNAALTLPDAQLGVEGNYHTSLGNEGATREQERSSVAPAPFASQPNTSVMGPAQVPQSRRSEGHPLAGYAPDSESPAPTTANNVPVTTPSNPVVIEPRSGPWTYPPSSPMESRAPKTMDTRALMSETKTPPEKRSPVPPVMPEEPGDRLPAPKQSEVRTEHATPMSTTLTQTENLNSSADGDSLFAPTQMRGSDAPAFSNQTGFQTASPAQQVEMARSVAQQIADVAVHRNGGTVEIRLNPEELGTVRMTLSGSESQLNVSIHVDRGETADLMRRHIDQLAREFREIGYSGLSFSFEQGSSGQRGTGSDTQNEAPVTESGESHGTVSSTQADKRLVVADGAMDMRI